MRIGGGEPLGAKLDYGGIYLVRLDPIKGAEVGKLRPAIILQTSAMLEEGVATVLVCPLSSEYKEGLGAIRVHISARERLLKDSYALIEHIRSISRRRLVPDKLAHISKSEYSELKNKVLSVLGFID